MAMERVKEKMCDKRTGDGKHRLFVIVQTFLAQRRLQEAIAQTQVTESVIAIVVTFYESRCNCKAALRFWLGRFGCASVFKGSVIGVLGC